MNSSHRGVCLVACLCLACLSSEGWAQTVAAPAQYLKQATVSQTAQTVRITADSPRPLEQILNALHLKYGWAINYEDPQYTSTLDLVESPASHTKLPSGGSFSVEYPAAAPDEEKTLRLVLDAYNHSKNPGQFELRRNAQGNFDVVGTGAHNDKGAIAPQQPLFDVPVTLPTEERTISATIDLIFQAIAQQNHSVVKVGVSPRTLLDHTPAKIGGAKVSARELLQQCLTATHRNLYWRLLFDPESKGYYLNIQLVHPVAAS
jgi:hypothetical protein